MRRIRSTFRNLGLLGASFALLLAGCSSSSDSGSSGGSNTGSASSFTIESVSVIEGQTWQINRPIDILFSREVDFGTVSLNTINIVTSSGVTATGTFSMPGTDARVVRFQPACPTRADYSDAGLRPGGVNYTLHVLDTTLNGVTVRSTGGLPVSAGALVNFVTPVSLSPQQLFLDTVAGPPAVRVRNKGEVSSTAVDATHLVLGDGTTHYFYQQLATQEGKLLPPGGVEFEPPINKYSEVDTQWYLNVYFNQPVVASATNISSDRITLEYLDGANNWQTFLSRVELVANCVQSGSVVKVTPLGIAPQGAAMRLNVKQGFSDLTGDALPANSTNTAVMSMREASNGLTLVDPDAFTEEFDTSGSGLTSGEDTASALAVPRATWGGGSLSSNFAFSGTGGPGGNFDFVVGFSGPETVVLDTTSAQILGGPDGIPVTTQTVINGVLDVDDLRILPGSKLVIVGPNPCTILAKGEVEILGELSINGGNNPGVGTLNTTFQPESGASGNGGGGAGGVGSFLTSQSTPKGGDGFGRGNVPNRGGRGGETSYATGGVTARRGAGGGGGVFGKDTRFDHDGDPDTAQARVQTIVGFDAEPGRGGGPNGKGAISQSVRAVGGNVGPSPFVDGDDTNDFYGTMITADNQLVIGEFNTIWGGAGGGGGGDSVNSNSFPLVPFQIGGDEKGAGGGGGAGGLTILAIGDIIVRDGGRLTADGGYGGGGENTSFFDRVGGGSGGGSGGHIVLSSAADVIVEGEAESALPWYTDFDTGGTSFPAFTDPRPVSALGGQGGAGDNNVGGADENGVTTWRCDCIPLSFVDVSEPFGCTSGGATDTSGDVPPMACSGCFWVSACKNDPLGPVCGAGGDGGPGIIQLHVANPAVNLQFPDLSAGQGGAVYGRTTVAAPNTILTPALDVTGCVAPPPMGWIDPEAELARVTALPATTNGPVTMTDAMIPFFGPQSVGQSRWIPMGLARVNPQDTPIVFSFGGTDTADGKVDRVPSGVTVQHPAAILAASLVDPAGVVAPYISGGGSLLVFDATTLPDNYKVNPNLVKGFSVQLGNAAVNPTVDRLYSIVAASYDSGNDRLTVTIDTDDGLLDEFPGTPVFASLVPMFFRISTAGVKDSYPDNTGVFITFDATLFDILGDPSEALSFSAANGGNFTGDISDLNAGPEEWDFIRYRVLFDLNADNLPGGVDLASPRPSLLFLSIPFEYGAQ